MASLSALCTNNNEQSHHELTYLAATRSVAYTAVPQALVVIAEVFWTCASHAFSTEAEEVMGLLLGDKVVWLTLSCENEMPT